MSIIHNYFDPSDVIAIASSKILKSGDIILSLDASHQALSIALWSKERGVICEHVTRDEKLALSSLLLPAIKEVLEKAQLKLPDIELFAATCGPGSFTGLRTGLATIKGLAEACARRVVAVPTLHAVALCEAQTGEIVCAMIPAGRSEVFVQLLKIADEDEVAELSAPAHLPAQSAIDLFCGREPLCWAGSAARQNESLIKNHSKDSSHGAVAASPHDFTVAVCAARIAYRKAKSGEASLPAQVRAIYVRPSDAELQFKR